VRTISANTTRLLDAYAQGPARGQHPAVDNLQQLHIPGASARYPLRCPTLSYPTDSEAHAHPLPVFPAATAFFPCLVQCGVHR